MANAVVLLIIVACAREIAAISLKLPPQDFDLTVNMLTFGLALPIWCGILALITLLFSIMAFFSAGQLGLAAHFAELCYFTNIFGKASWLARLESVCSIERDKALAHAVGAGVLAMILLFPLGFLCIKMKNFAPFIRIVAYYCDFKPATMFPGVVGDERIRIHGNGFISSARRLGNDVIIYTRLPK